MELSFVPVHLDGGVQHALETGVAVSSVHDTLSGRVIVRRSSRVRARRV